MKNSILIGLVCLFACQSKKTNLEQVQTEKERQRHIAAQLEAAYAQDDYLPIRGTSKPYKDGKPFNREFSFRKYEANYDYVKDWQFFDSLAILAYEKYRHKDHFYTDGQWLSATMLKNCLLKQPEPHTPKVIERMSFYTQMMLDNEGVNWHILVPALAKLRAHWDSNRWEAALAYIRRGAQKDKEMLASTLAKTPASDDPNEAVSLKLAKKQYQSCEQALRFVEDFRQ